MLFTVIGRLVVYGALAYVVGAGLAWGYIIVALLIEGPTVASIGG